jgi:hypothetical protein
MSKKVRKRTLKNILPPESKDEVQYSVNAVGVESKDGRKKRWYERRNWVKTANRPEL